jgi:hypothetical protein
MGFTFSVHALTSGVVASVVCTLAVIVAHNPRVVAGCYRVTRVDRAPDIVITGDRRVRASLK